MSPDDGRKCRSPRGGPSSRGQGGRTRDVVEAHVKRWVDALSMSDWGDDPTREVTAGYLSAA